MPLILHFTASRMIGLCLLLLLCIPALAQVDAENQSIAAVHGENFVRALNELEPQARERMLESAYAPSLVERVGLPKLIEQVGRVSAQLAPLEFHSAQLNSFIDNGNRKYALHVFARSNTRQQGWLDFQFYIDPEQDWRLTQLIFIAEVTEPVVLPNGDIAHAHTLEWLNTYLDELVEQSQLSGSLLIREGEHVLLNRAFGFADADRRRPIDQRTEFNMASGSKLFTAVLVMRLVAQEQIALDDPVAPHFVDEPSLQTKLDKITLRQLLSHSAGLGDFWTHEFAQARSGIIKTADLLPWILKAEQDFAPGTAQRYSNSNLAVAGLLLERITGQSYHRQVQQHILQPLGMRHSTCHQFSKRSHLADALQREAEGWAPVAGALGATAAGGCRASAEDVMRFMRAFSTDQLLPKAHSQMMLQPQFATSTADSEGFGLGFQLFNAPGARAYGHGGTAPGANFDTRHYPDRDLTVVIFSNQDNGAFDSLKRTVHKLITGER